MAELLPRADRRHLLRVALLTLGYLISLFAADRLIEGGQVSGWPAYLLAVLPGLFLAGTFLAVGQLIIEEKDEYRRLLLIRQTLIATGFTLALITVWGHLEEFGLVPDFDAPFIAIFWAIGLVIGSVYNLLTLAPTEAE